MRALRTGRWSVSDAKRPDLPDLSAFDWFLCVGVMQRTIRFLPGADNSVRRAVAALDHRFMRSSTFRLVYFARSVHYRTRVSLPVWCSPVLGHGRCG